MEVGEVLEVGGVGVPSAMADGGGTTHDARHYNAARSYRRQSHTSGGGVGSCLGGGLHGRKRGLGFVSLI